MNPISQWPPMILVRSNHFIATDIGRHHQRQIPSCSQQKTWTRTDGPDDLRIRLTSEPKQEVL